MDPEELLNENSSNDKAKSPLLSLEVDLRFFSESIREVAVEIMVEGLSQYPIFIAHQHDVDLGEIILDKNELNSEWSVQASTLEEFIDRGVIKKELRERFISSYKNPHEYMCIFAIVPEGANFVYFPYAKE